MLDTKYVIDKIDELSGRNCLHSEIEGKVCYPVYLNVGESGRLLVDYGTADQLLHIVRTAKVKDIETLQDNGFSITTENTKYTFRDVSQ